MLATSRSVCSCTALNVWIVAMDKVIGKNATNAKVNQMSKAQEMTDILKVIYVIRE